ncbi:hypothetical protein VaNZ11_016941 [Volvox africanus]|uniref:Spindle and centriole-associated protein 1 n=1 Tax=Volvox africanus TaxID=51714 RepID=A0ABQ5SQJ5_9CHLO|nr:hypothetical protein VaNZ11_016941 [Volvox africanus]
MPQTRGRSTSLQRGSRAGSTKRGQRSSAQRRLSDLHERPAWDATSSNLEKLKLTAEEQERRRASRVSKNRPLTTFDVKRDFVEAWAKHVTSSAPLHGDTDPDQDHPRSSSVTRDMSGINYGSVVEMLRKSPSSVSRGRPHGIAALADTADTRRHHRVSSDGTAGGSTCAPRGADSLEEICTLASGQLLSNISSVSAAIAPVRSTGDSTWATVEAASASAGSSATLVPAAVAETGSRTSQRASATAAGKGRDVAPALGEAAGASAAAAAEAAADAGCSGSSGTILHRAGVGITSVELRRPRFNPADATTIIAFREGSDDDGEDDNSARQRSSSSSPDHGTTAAVAAMRGGARGGGKTDPLTAAFEAALLGREGGGPASSVRGGSATLAWATSRDAASPLDAAASDVERRLHAVESALGLTARGLAGGGGGGGSGRQLLQEEVSELRRELQQVQMDNVKLRQELSTFSTHASAMMTQLQAQVQQLLRRSSGGGGGIDTGTSTAATATSAVAAAVAPLPLSARPQRPAPSSRTAQQQAAMVTTGAPTAAASIPTTIIASAGAGYAPHGGLYGNRPLPHPHQSAAQNHQPPSLAEQSQPVVRRNIFSDLDISSFRPMGTTGTLRNGEEDEAPAGTPVAAAAAAAYQPVTGGYTPPPAAASASPLIDIALVPSASYTVPVRDIDGSELALPSFSAFRRSASTVAFTAARPATSGTIDGSHNPHQSANLNAAAAPEPVMRLSPSNAHSNVAVVQPRPFPTQYQPRSIGGVIVKPGNSSVSVPPPPATGVGMTAASAAGGANAVGGTYTASLATSTAAAATGSNAAAVALARTHSGLPQPLVFSVGPEFRTARATGLSAENSLSLSAHTAAAAAVRAKSSLPAPAGPR